MRYGERMAVTVESAIPSMAPRASLLLYMTMGRLGDYLFGTRTSQDAQFLLEPCNCFVSWVWCVWLASYGEHCPSWG